MSWITLTWEAQLQNFRFAAGIEKTPADWGISSASLEKQNLSQDVLGFDIPTSAKGPEIFNYGDRITIKIGRQGVVGANESQPSAFSGGQTFFVGYRQRNARTASGRMQRFQYKITGPWGFFMDRHEFQKSWPSWNGKELVQQPTTSVTLGESADVITQANGVQTTQMTIAEQVIEIVNFTIAQTVKQYGSAQFQLDSNFADSNFDGVGGWNGYCPLDAANDLTCAEAIKKTVKIVPSVSSWFDYSTTPPTLHIATRDTLPSIALTYGNASTSNQGGNYTSKIDRRDDLIPPCVDYKYRITGTFNNQQYIQIVDDLACAEGQTDSNGFTPVNLLPFSEYFGAELATFDFEGDNFISTTLNTLPIPFNSLQPGALAIWTQQLVSSLSDPSITQVSIPADPNTGLPQLAVLTNPDGSLADPRYQYFLVGGPVPSWVKDSNNPNLAQGVKLTLSQDFIFTKSATTGTYGQADWTIVGPVSQTTERKTVDLYCYSMGAGVFTSETPGEPIPFGLAAFVYNIEKIPQYDGAHGIVETDPQTGYPTITDPCPFGNNLNLLGNQEEFETMMAQLQTATYDFMTGHTEYTFGVATHLGGADYIQRLRINRGPRWYNLISSGLVNESGNVSGATQLKDTQQAASFDFLNWMPNGATPSFDTGTAPLPIGLTFNTNTTTTTSGSGSTVAASPIGGQIIMNTGPSTAQRPVTTPASSWSNASQVALAAWTSAAQKTTFITLSIADLNTIFSTAGGITFTNPDGTTFKYNSVRLQVLKTCDGTNTARVFACSDPFVVPAGWGGNAPLSTPQPWTPPAPNS